MAANDRPEIYYATELLGSGVVIAFGIAALRLPSIAVGSFSSHQIGVFALLAAVLSAVATIYREYKLSVDPQVSLPVQFVAVPLPRPASSNSSSKSANSPSELQERSHRWRAAFRTAFMDRPSVRSGAPVQTL